MRTRSIFSLLAGACVVSTVLAVGGRFASQLFLDGKPVSSDVRTIDGHAYVPVADVAKALGLSIVSSGGGLNMVHGGGANQIANKLEGKVGDEIFSGKWKFTVLDVSRGKSYDVQLNNQISGDNRHLTAGANEDLVSVKCRVKNGTPNKDELVFASDWEGIRDALTDQDENTYAPIAFDVVPTEGAPLGVSFLPGSAINFTMVFRIPASASPKDVIFTAERYSMRGSGDIKKEPPQDFRVTLQKP